MTKNTSSNTAVQTLSDDALDEVVGGWGGGGCHYRPRHCGYRPYDGGGQEGSFGGKPEQGGDQRQDSFEPKRNDRFGGGHRGGGWGYGC